MKYKVKFLGSGFMADEAQRVIAELPNIDLVMGVWDCDILLTVSHAHRLNDEWLKAPRIGAINVHSGLLPKQRGYHPLNWALIWGDRNCGVTLHKLAESIDAGDIIHQIPFPIGFHDVIHDLREKSRRCVEPLLRRFFSNVDEMMEHAKQQDQSEATYAPKRFASDSQLNLNASEHDIYNLWRSCDPLLYPAFVIENGVKRLVCQVTPFGEVKYAE